MSPFLTEALAKRPLLTPPFLHRKFNVVYEQVCAFARLETGGSILAVVGPSQSGKSLLMTLLIDLLITDIFRDAQSGTAPVVGCSAQTARDGRTSLKYIYEMLLAEAGGILHDPEKLQHTVGYNPVRSNSEAAILGALLKALRCLRTRFVIIDEAQYIVRAKDAFYRSTILESLKSLISESRTLVLFGGYEFLDALVSHQAHLVARSTILNIDRYCNTRADRKHWIQVLKQFELSQSLSLANPTLLCELSDYLLEQTFGVVGLLERRLQRAHMLATLDGGTITEEHIRNTELTSVARDTFEQDLSLGDELLATTCVPKRKAEKKARNSKKGNAPFDSNPTRSIGTYD